MHHCTLSRPHCRHLVQNSPIQCYNAMSSLNSSLAIIDQQAYFVQLANNDFELKHGDGSSLYVPSLQPIDFASWSPCFTCHRYPLSNRSRAVML
jgi:hypothetical protein